VRLVRFLALQLALVFGIATAAHAALPRVALVIGINDYPNLGDRDQLKKAEGDALAISERLRELNYSVRSLRNAARRDVPRIWEEVLDQVDENGIALFFFSGHGIEVQSENYLLTSDAPSVLPKSRTMLRDTFVSLQALIQQFKDKQKKGVLALFIIDACRQHPSMSDGVKAIEGGRGLVPVRLDPADGELFIMYSAGVSQLALDRLSDDDPEVNSVYTRKLLPLLSGDGARRNIADVAQEVRTAVYELAHSVSHPQTPAYYDQLIERRNFLGQKLIPSREQQIAALPIAGAAFAVTTRALSQGAILSDCPGCPEVVVLPSGHFVMGSPETEPGHQKSEEPEHMVMIGRPFAMGKSEITNREWNVCVKSGGCPENDYRGLSSARSRDLEPVTDVSWKDASAYAQWLSRVSSQRYRLPSEAEFEYAARATTRTRYSFGDDEKDLCNYANGADQSLKAFFYTNAKCSDGYARSIAPRERFKPNPWGLHDVHGNVWEWVEDCWFADYRDAPADGSARDGKQCDRVVRGGSWRSAPERLRSAARHTFAEDHRRMTLGFRVVRELTGTELAGYSP
jgi:formylglycine-generating enzyme required for sulfatase activity